MRWKLKDLQEKKKYTMYMKVTMSNLSFFITTVCELVWRLPGTILNGSFAVQHCILKYRALSLMSAVGTWKFFLVIILIPEMKDHFNFCVFFSFA